MYIIDLQQIFISFSIAYSFISAFEISRKNYKTTNNWLFVLAVTLYLNRFDVEVGPYDLFQTIYLYCLISFVAVFILFYREKRLSGTLILFLTVIIEVFYYFIIKQ